MNLDEAQRRRIRSLIRPVNPMMKESAEPSGPFEHLPQAALPVEHSLEVPLSLEQIDVTCLEVM
jgi:hypothetical protein